MFSSIQHTHTYCVKSVITSPSQRLANSKYLKEKKSQVEHRGECRLYILLRSLQSPQGSSDVLRVMRRPVASGVEAVEAPTDTLTITLSRIVVALTAVASVALAALAAILPGLNVDFISVAARSF